MDYPDTEMLVDFHKWCKECKYRYRKEIKDPCNECLVEASRFNTTKPVYFEEDK